MCNDLVGFKQLVDSVTVLVMHQLTNIAGLFAFFFSSKDGHIGIQSVLVNIQAYSRLEEIQESVKGTYVTNAPSKTAV